MDHFHQATIRITLCVLVSTGLGACAAQPPGTSISERSFEQLVPGEFASMSIDERLSVMADVCPDGTKPYCRVRPGRDLCGCIEDDQMRRNLELVIR